MMHIALTIDSKFVRYCAVTIVSILENNDPKDIMLHIVSGHLPKEDVLTLSQVAEKYGTSIAFYYIPHEKLQNYEVKWQKQRLSMVVFYRCVLASILPSTISRVIYLDSDTLVLGSLKELWDTNLNQLALAGVQDTDSPNPSYFERLQYAPSYNYINGGVLLLNLAYWRKHNIEQQCIKYYQQYPDRIILNDQDILNALLYDQKVLIDIKWNVQDDFYRNNRYTSPAWKPSYTDAILHPIILHYSGRKPWAYHAMHPLRHLFFHYQRLTPYDDSAKQKKISTRIYRFIHLLPYILGLKPKKYVNLKKIRENSQITKL